MTDFDAKARTWDADPAKGERAQRVAEAIAREAPVAPWMTVLEYGCGTGLLGLALQPRVRQVTLADSSREMLAVVREKIAAAGIGNATAVEVDLASDGPLDARFDLVCTLMTLHHIADTDRILRRFHELLRPGGILCVSDLDREDGAFHGPGFDGHNGFSRDDLGARFRRAGFRDVRFSTPCEVTKPVGGVERRFPIFLAVGARE